MQITNPTDPQTDDVAGYAPLFQMPVAPLVIAPNPAMQARMVFERQREGFERLAIMSDMFALRDAR